ncbi:MAG: RES family NAD+ phosphorylase [Bacteroidota bacterium]
MNVYRISKCEYISDLQGTGAALYPGRWHSKGTYILYTAATPSLAMLESVVHISNIAIASFCMTCLSIPEDKIKTITVEELPGNWFENPPPDILKKTGDSFIKENKFLALKIPSAIMPEENNFLLNPGHNDFKKVSVIYTPNIPIDERLLKIK